MVWTKAKPTGPGWYWRRANGRDEHVVEVEHHGYDGRLAYACGWYARRNYGGTQWDWVDVPDDEVEWCGPIPEPGEPAE